MSAKPIRCDFRSLAFRMHWGKLPALQKFHVPSLWLNRFWLAVLAGLLLAAAFPKMSLAGAAWIAPGLLLFAAQGQRSGTTFRLGYVAGLTFFLSSLYWLLFMPYRWHGIPVAPAAGWLALSAYCALYPAVWVWLCLKVSSFQFQASGSAVAGSPPRPFAHSALHAIPGFPATWARRAIWALACAAIWTALEFIRGRFLTGFPWNFLAASQYQMLPLIQCAAISGAYGVSFLIAWFSVSLASTAMVLVQRPDQRSAWVAEIIVPFVVLAAIAGHGWRQLIRPPLPAAQLKLALVQPSIPQMLLWDPNETTNRFNRLIELSQAALADRPDALIWPEAALPSFDDTHYRTITNLVRAHNVWMIIGADDAEPPVDGNKDYNYFNAAFLISPAGKLMGSYRKRRLVIFGEYVPLSRWLPFMKWLTPIQGDFTPGDRPVPFEFDLEVERLPRPDDGPRQPESPRDGGTPAGSRRQKMKCSALICFEDMFPHLAREHAEEDTDFLLNLTNDGWFGESAAHWQQAASSVFRAVENGMPLVRCANNGLTCWVDAQGRLREVLGHHGRDVYRAGFINTEIPLLDGRTRRQTFYNRHGDWFAWCCVGLTLALLVPQALRRRAERVPAL